MILVLLMGLFMGFGAAMGFAEADRIKHENRWMPKSAWIGEYRKTIIQSVVIFLLSIVFIFGPAIASNYWHLP